ncbi:MAG: hypothetical protein CMF98_06640 [Candidatus Marinimicrobia bacterium]|nr:hypothetical protein [Candidatus Neomarinimicrobiota bacterium]OUW49928.1 MAG: hypothetical protein CBD50_04500 [bacterium TMED190]
MKSNLMKIFLINFVLLFLCLNSQPNSSIAVLSKVKGEVSVKNNSDFKDFIKVNPGYIFKDGDHVKTGINSFAVLIYLDDKSMVKLKSSTSLVINGIKDGNGINKNLNLNNGAIKSIINKQKKGEFKVTSPTSVASVKGTSFWSVTNFDQGDTFFNEEGIVEIKNLISGEIIDLLENQTGVSLSSGLINISQTIQSEIPIDEDSGENVPQELRIILTGPNQEQKILIIKYN